MVVQPARRRLDDADRSTLVANAASVLAEVRGLAAAWLHGSVVRGEPADDVDVAVLAAFGADAWNLADEAGSRLERTVPVGLPWDVRPVSRDASPAFRHAVVRDGVLLAERDRDARETFWLEAVRDYLDIAPFLQRAHRDFLDTLARRG